ncbi:uncharacterized mitochondrial protein AtMg00810-like [Lycium barbarum]|uniref:uncharacterized mitochondrial protein AtMg00810-like n=1 Tax=Lycium barbarum TaxID=112863 RepID=UPI00293E0713|nr:uncharacterized mitochondrial protein AtMg00810-like [Lycium barbarum]
MTTVKTLVVVAVKQKWPLFQLDVNNAFLHGDLDKEVYMKLPPGYSLSDSSSSVPLACKLQKSLYGGYTHSLNDYSLFTGSSGSSFVLLAVYVDDIILTGTNATEIDTLKSFLHKQFRIKDLRCLNYFLGIEVLYTDSGVLLHQKKFIHDLLRTFNCNDVSPILCLLDMTVKLKQKEGDPLPKPDEYRSLIGKLNFLTHTRPNICFAVQHLSQFMQSPCLPHMKAALHLLRCLKGIATHGIFFISNNDHSVSAFCDSDWAACSDTRKSVSGFCVLLGGCLVAWKSKKQPVVSLSLAEAEYMAMSKVVAEVTWLSMLLSDLVVTCPSIPVYCDNQAVIHIARNPVFHERTKHIELDCHFVRTKRADGLIHLLHTSSSTKLADIFTKVLGGASHHGFLPKLGILSSSNLKGGVGIPPVPN